MELIKAILIFIMLFCLLACDIDPFPVDKVYLIDRNLKTCDQYKVYDVENVKFKYDKSLAYEECPIAFGFTKEDTGKLMSWIRRQKKQMENNQ